MFLAIAAILSLIFGSLAVAGPALATEVEPEDKHCADHESAPVKIQDGTDPDEGSFVIDGVTVYYVMSGPTVSFYDGTGADKQPVTLEFCVKASLDNSGMQTGSTFTVDWLNPGEQTPDISYFVVWAHVDGGEEPETGNPDVQVTKKAFDASRNRIDNVPDHTIPAGSDFIYFFLVYNSGDEAANGVVLSDDLDDDLVINSTYFDVDPGTSGGTGTCSVAAGNVVTCELGTLAASDGDSEQPEADSAFVEIHVTATENACGDVTNQAFVSADNESEGAAGNNASAVISLEIVCDGGEQPGNADVQVLKMAVDENGDPVTQVGPDGSFKYVIIVYNSGSVEAENVIISDDLDDDIVIDETFYDVNPGEIGGIGSCSVAAGNVVSCSIGNLAPSDHDSEQPEPDSAFARIEITVTEDACGSISNQAFVSADNEPDHATVNNASEIVTVNVECEDGERTEVTVMVMKHNCDEVNTVAEFEAVEARAATNPTTPGAAFGPTVETVLECPTVVLSGDTQTPGAVAGGVSAFEFTVADGATTQTLSTDGAFAQVGACEDDVQYDANRNTVLDENVCLDLSHYGFTVSDGTVTVTETVAPAGFSFGALRFTPGSGDQDALVSASAGVIVLDTTLDADGMIMLHVYNFATGDTLGGGGGPKPTEGTKGSQGGPTGGQLPNTSTNLGGSLPAVLVALTMLAGLGFGGYRMAEEARRRR